MNSARLFVDSDLDGTESGGFIILNVDAPFRNPCQVLEDERGQTYFASLTEARTLCSRLRESSDNDMIFVYAVPGVRLALEAQPDAFNRSL